MTTTDAARPDPLAGRNIAITGGTSGLGLALVKELLARGAKVAFIARTADSVRRVASEHTAARGIVISFCPAFKRLQF